MKLRLTSEVTVIEKSKSDYEYEGKKGVTYSAICMQKDGDSAGVDTINVTEDVYNKLSPMTSYRMAGSYDTKYRRFQFDGCQQLK